MDNKEKSPEKELIESIGLMIEKGMESNTNIYTGVVKSVDGKRAVVAVNGQNQNVSIATADVSSGNVVRVFVPQGNMSAAFIIKAEASGGGGPTTTAYGDLTGKPQINGVTLVDNKTSKELNLYGTGNEPPYPVTSVNGQTGDVTIEVGGNVDSVNGKTGAVVLSAADVGALPNTTVIPDKTSQLDNDSGYITNSALTGYAKKTEIPTKTSELTNDSGYITANDVPVKSVDGATGDVVTNAVKTTTQTLTDTQKQQARTNIGAGTSNFSGSYDDLSNKPTIPDPYTLPVANSTTLGGVKPVAKTSNMTQSVGVDVNGALYTAPGGGGTGSGDMLKSVYDPQNKSTDIFKYANDVANARQAKILVDGILEGDGAGNISAAETVQTELLDVEVLPTVTTADNGKILKVTNGAWVAQQPTTEAWTFTLEDGSTITKNVCIE